MSKKIPIPTKDVLYNLYFIQNTRLVDVAKIYKTTTTTVKSWFRLYKFPRKDRKLANKLGEETNLQKYGSKNVFSCQEIQEKIKETNLVKFGCEYALSNPDVRTKIKKTVRDRYGVDHVAQVKAVQEKVANTNMERYGYPCAFSNKDFIQKCVFDKYGVKSNLEREDVKAKIKVTNLERYGVENPLMSPIIQAACKKRCNDLYGVDNPTQQYYSEKTKGILFNKESFCSFIDSYKYPNAHKIADDLGVNANTIAKYAKQYGVDNKFVSTTSAYEQELCVLYPSIFRKDRTVLYPREIDLYSPEHKLGIEFDGNYWHCDAQKKDVLYHQHKSLDAQANGVFIYHIFEYEWLDHRKNSIIKSQLSNLLGNNQTRVFARKCVVKDVSAKDTRKFLEENHLQGYCPSAVSIGLYYNEELVSLMTFGNPRFSKNCVWELHRFCNKLGTSVVGGASKLFKHFVTTYKPKSILSYSNIAKATGKLYKTLGFVCKGVTQPNYVWVKSYTVLTRYQCQKKKLVEQGFDKELSENEIMRNRGFYKFYDCGNFVWIMNFKEK